MLVKNKQLCSYKLVDYKTHKFSFNLPYFNIFKLYSNFFRLFYYFITEKSRYILLLLYLEISFLLS